MFLLPYNASLHGNDTGGVDDFESQTDGLDAAGNANEIAESTKGVPLDTISREFAIPAGKQYYVYFDNTTKTLKEMKMPDERAGLPDKAQQAIDLSPNWLKPNLTRKFGYLSEENIWAGSYSNPAFADIDLDGDSDLIMGLSTGTLNYYENVDDGYHYYEGYDYFINAVYVQNDSMFGGIDVGDNSDPTFADLDNDTYVDMIVGDSTGALVYYRNNGGAGWDPPVTLGIGVSGYSAPYLVDFDGDTDFDLFVGSIDGQLNYSNNTGTPSVPSWSAFTTVYLDGNVSNVTDVGEYSNPAAADLFDDDGDIDLVVGAYDGKLRYYRNDDDNLTEVSTLPDLYFSSIDIGVSSSPALLDLDSNLALDIAIGAATGYLFYRENIGTASNPKWFWWLNTPVGFNGLNINDYYEDNENVNTFSKLRHRANTTWLDDYSQMIIDIASSPDTIKQLDEFIFTIAHTSTASLALAPTGFPLVFPEVYRNNTEALYYNDQFIDYANILDFNVGTAEQWSTVEYWVNESGKRTRYVHPKEVYYWFIVHPRLSDEVVTFIDPNVATWGHWWNAAQPPPIGKFWRWSAFNEADPDWPLDPPGAVKYPKIDLPPVMKDHLVGVTTMWNGERYNAPNIYNNSGYDTGARPWDYKDHAIEKVSQWVERTLALSAAEGMDTNRPHQPVRIQ
ncbi:MAG: VCBS repeat-containing protein, partial [Thermoplasmata archaeon]|nr:VCBS repeat-containing protein [Thermoplasmata archaeon]